FQAALLDFSHHPEQSRDLLNAAKTQCCPVPVLAVSTQMDAELDREAIPAGAADYLVLDSLSAPQVERSIRYAIERKRTEQARTWLAHNCHYTDMPTRVLFLDRLETDIRSAALDRMRFAMMFLVLNDFKQVNVRYGHDMGDSLIRMCAGRLQKLLR